MKPCPFCGSRARVQSYRKLYGKRWARVMCTNKGCAARGPTVTGACRPGERGLDGLTEEELNHAAEACWNGRAE